MTVERRICPWADHDPASLHYRDTEWGNPLRDEQRLFKLVILGESLDLKCRGFSFVGPTICYALMQAAGLVCDHLAWCDRHPDILSGNAYQELPT